MPNAIIFNKIPVFKSFTKQVPLYGTFLAFFSGIVLSFFFFQRNSGGGLKAKPVEPAAIGSPCGITVTRVFGYNYTKPLLYFDQNCESANLATVKTAVGELIRTFKESGDITSASVYLRVFEQGEWTSLNEKETYHPGSLYKVPVMIAWLQMAENTPGLLDKEFLFELPKDKVLNKQNYISASIESGKKYTVRELLRYMISHSDNKAHWLLSKFIDVKVMDDVFLNLGLGLPMPGDKGSTVQVTAKNYSIFMKTLFNSSYLTPQYSEFALSLLGDCSFKEGFAKGLPVGTKVAHKFGE